MATRTLDEQSFVPTATGGGIVLIDFWAPWCGPCRVFGPVFEQVSEANPDLIFAKVNTEESQELAAALRIQSIPTLMVFRDGVLVFREAGALPRAMLEELIAAVRALDMDDVRRQVEETRTRAAAS